MFRRRSKKINTPLWYLNDGSLVPPLFGGSSAATFTRATTAQGVDQDGRSYLCAAGVPRQDGYYTVVNLLTASEDMTNGAYTDGSGAVSTATQTTFDGTANGNVHQDVTIVDDNSGAGGRQFRHSVWIRLVSGTVSSDAALQLFVRGTAIDGAAIQAIGDTVTSTAQRFSVLANTDAAGTVVSPEVRWDDAGVLEITKWQLEEVTGQLNQNPGPYVSTGVGTGSEKNTGADGASASGATAVTTGWSVFQNALVTAVADGTSETGFYIESENNTTSTGGGNVSVDLNSYAGGLTVGKDYVLTAQVRHVGTGGSYVFGTGSDGTMNSNQVTIQSLTSVDTTWATVTYLFTFSATNRYLGMRESNAGNNGGIRVSGISIKEADHGSNIDGIKRFPYLNGNTVSSGLVTEANGPRISGKTCKYGVFDGVVGSYVSSPDSAVIPTGSVTLIAGLAPDQWSGYGATQTILSKFSGAGTRTFNWDITNGGNMRLSLSADGTNEVLASVSTPSFADGTHHFIAAVHDDDADTTDFYSSDDPRGTPPSEINWTQVGAQQSHVVSGLYDGSAAFNVGGYQNGTNAPFSGIISRAAIISGTDLTATPALDYNANDWTAGQTFESSTTSEVWTINGNVGIYGPLSKWIDVDGSSDGWTSPDSAAASIESDIFIAAWGAADDWTTAGSQYICGKNESAGNKRGYILGVSATTGTLRLLTSADGITSVTSVSDTAPSFTNGVMHGFGASWDDSANETTYWTTTDSPWTPPNLVNWTQLGDPVAHVSSGINDSAALITVGGYTDNVDTLEWTGRIMRAYAIASTDPTVAPAWDFDPRTHQSGTTMTMTTGEVWTAVGNGTIEGGKFPVAPFKTDGTQEPLGYLPETASTNAAFYSNALDNAAWSKSGCTVDANAARASDGTLTASRINVTADANLHGVNDTQLTNTSGRNVSFTAELKNDGERYVYLNLATSAEDHITAVFDLTDGVITATDAGTTSGTIVLTKMVAMNDGWFRCTLVGSIAEAAALLWMIGSAGSAVPTFDTFGRVSFTPSDGEDFFATRVNVENNASFPSSYIPTTSAAVTRNKDDLSYASAGNAATPMTVMADFTPNQLTVTSQIICIDDGDASDRVVLQSKSTGKVRSFMVAGSSTVADIDSDTTGIVGVTSHAAMVAATNNVSQYKNGASQGTPDTSAAEPGTLTTINMGQAHDASAQPSGHINNVQIYAGVLSANEIEKLAR